MLENSKFTKQIHIVTNDDFFFLLFKTFIVKIDPGCNVHKVELIHETYSINSLFIVRLPLLIVVDATISYVSPIDVVNMLRSDLQYKMPIWFVTEITSPIYLSKIMDVGANRIISKPFDPEKLAAEVVSLINKTIV